MPTEDFEEAQYLSAQVEQARQRAVLAASDAGAARSDAAGSEQQAREYARRAQAAADATSDAPQNAAEAKAAAASAIAASGAADTAKIAAQAAAAISSTAAATAKQEAIADATTKYGGLPGKVTTLEGNRFYRGHNLVSDLNNATEQGRYTFGSLPANAPTTALGDVDVHVTGTTVVQEWTTLESVPRKLSRRRSGGTWGSWAAQAEQAMQGRGILDAGTNLNTLNLPQHNGIYGLSSGNWPSYVGLPSGITEANRGTLEIVSPNNWTVTQRIYPSGGTKRYERVMTSPTGPVFGPWQVIDSAASGSGEGSATPDLPTANWVHWGDSLTDAAALGADAWVTKLAALTGKNHINEGWYGQQAAQIAARQGGNPALMTVEGGSIPASGTQVKVVAATPHVSMPVGAQQPTRQVAGTLAGRTGYLVDGGADATDGFFMPTDGKGSTAAAGSQQFIPAPLGRDRIMTICIGENDIWSTGPSPQHVAYMARQMFDYQNTLVKRVLVLSIPRRAGAGKATTTGQKVEAINNALRAEFPSIFVDVAGYLMSNQAAIDAGITYTPDDLADIADGVTPRSFRLPSDSVHYNALACSIVAPFVYAAARDRGWVS